MEARKEPKPWKLQKRPVRLTLIVSPFHASYAFRKNRPVFFGD
jgi:hypothetical protein